MKFYGKKNRIVWNPEENRRLVKFDKNGEVEVDKKETIEKLKAMGYMGDFTEPTAGFEEVGTDIVTPKTEKPLEANSDGGIIPNDFDEMTKPQLIEYCKVNKITGYSNKTSKGLKAMLKG